MGRCIGLIILFGVFIYCMGEWEISDRFILCGVYRIL